MKWNRIHHMFLNLKTATDLLLTTYCDISIVNENPIKFGALIHYPYWFLQGSITYSKKFDLFICCYYKKGYSWQGRVIYTKKDKLKCHFERAERNQSCKSRHKGITFISWGKDYNISVVMRWLIWQPFSLQSHEKHWKPFLPCDIFQSLFNGFYLILWLRHSKVHYPIKKLLTSLYEPRLYLDMILVDNIENHFIYVTVFNPFSMVFYKEMKMWLDFIEFSSKLKYVYYLNIEHTSQTYTFTHT